ncbi:hypothetical protein I203_100163 [Kwoniella mangroviensis CBS 8507]|uniref:uncharacterized protein n=1 Tax=Kwoniella mangroviensis CBS 8507 TaxID=1296122 RepID=UPI00080CF91A|nr:uncharacterized protein I203_08068 [Kwoniella mangroviensis CBS 8507]OCF62844.1 hypothetical protein I203_08068 [Kwoniella mangroviensis CBS 8507]
MPAILPIPYENVDDVLPVDHEETDFFPYADRIVLKLNREIEDGRSHICYSNPHNDQVGFQRFQCDSRHPPAGDPKPFNGFDHHTFDFKRPSSANPYNSPWSPGALSSSPSGKVKIPFRWFYNSIQWLRRFLGIDTLPVHQPLVYQVYCDSYIHTGNLWDVYRGTIRTIGSNLDQSVSKKVVIKLTNPNEFLLHTPQTLPWNPYDRNAYKHTTESAQKAVLKEDYIYRHVLVSEQGSVVPLYFGTFAWFPVGRASNSPKVIMQISEDVGELLYPDKLRISLEPAFIRQKIYDLYQEAIYKNHALHGSVFTRHIMQRPNGQLALVDFQNAIGHANKKPLGHEYSYRIEEEEGESSYLLLWYEYEDGKVVVL